MGTLFSLVIGQQIRQILTQQVFLCSQQVIVFLVQIVGILVHIILIPRIIIIDIYIQELIYMPFFGHLFLANTDSFHTLRREVIMEQVKQPQQR